MKFLDVPQSGSIAGTTHSHNRAGQYTRNRRAPVQPIGTGRRAFIRAAFGSQSSQWSNLTFPEQAAWSAYADGHPITDSLGQSIKLTGQQMYVSCNTSLLNAGAPASSVPPAVSGVFSMGAYTFTATSAGVVTVTMLGNGSPDDFALLAFSAPVSGGVTFEKTFNQLTVKPGDTSTAVLVGPAYVAQFGLPVVNQRIFCRATPVNQYGVKGTPVIQLATVT